MAFIEGMLGMWPGSIFLEVLDFNWIFLTITNMIIVINVINNNNDNIRIGELLAYHMVILWMVAKSDKPPKGWLKTYK